MVLPLALTFLSEVSGLDCSNVIFPFVEFISKHSIVVLHVSV